ncbi:MAG: sugar nucleotide-binding protein [Verrucomicrobiota bacterium]
MILILGGRGYVASAFHKYLSSVGLEHKVLSRAEVDYAKRENLQEALRYLRPHFVINAAGYTGKPNVDATESKKTLCVDANLSLVCKLADICTDMRIPMGHVSSGCIFSGSRADGSGFIEKDPPNFDFRHNNCSFYSGTKSLAEEVLNETENVYLWRLRIPFNEIDSPRNYLTKIMNYERLLNVRNSISQLDEFARACCQCWEKRIPFGKYNVTNPGSVTTEEVVEMIVKAGFCKNRKFAYFKDEQEFLEKAAKTPRASCIMDSSKILNCGISLTEVHESLEWCLNNWKS